MNMSSHGSPVNESDGPPKRRIQRRHGACEPCRASKTKCDGRTPCGACRSERRRQCPCVYSEKAMKLQQVTAEVRRRAESEKRHCDEASRPACEHEASRLSSDVVPRSELHSLPTGDAVEISSHLSGRAQPMSESTASSARMSLPLSVCAAVDEFKRLKPARGYSAQVVSRCNGFDLFDKQEREQHQGSMQLHDVMSSPQAAQHSLDATGDTAEMMLLEDRLDAVDAMVNQGQLERAWARLGGIVREAQLIQDQAIDNQSPPCSTAWRHLWNNILELESRLGLTVGRPISLVPARTVSLTDKDENSVSLEDSLEGTRADLYHHIHGILGLELSSETAIRDFLERARDIFQHEPFYHIGLCTTKEHSSAVRDLHLNTHLLYMVIYCRMASLCDLFSRDLTNGSWSDTPAAEIIRSLNLHQPRQKLAYCRKMFRSANFILDSFITLSESNKAQNGSHWIRCHSAYIAAVILGIAKLRHEVEWHATTEKLRRLERLFLKLSAARPDCSMFATAVERLQDLNCVKEPAIEATRLRHSGIKNRKRGSPGSILTNPKGAKHRNIDSDSTSASVSPAGATVRSPDLVDNISTESLMPQAHYGQHSSHQHDVCQIPQPFEDLNLDHLFMFQDNSATYSQSSANFTHTSCSTGAVSFSESELSLQAGSSVPINHPGPPFAYPFPYSNFHPPMVWNNPVYVMNDHNTTPLTLSVPTKSHYGSEDTSMPGDGESQYDLQCAIKPKQPNANPHMSTRIQTLLDGNVATTGPPPVGRVQPRLISGALRRTNMEQPFSQQDSMAMANDEHLRSSRRPSLDQGHLGAAAEQSRIATQDNEQSLSANWHPTSVLSVAPNAQPQTSRDSIRMSAPRTRSDMARNLTEQDRNDDLYHSNVTAPPTTGMLGGRAFTSDHITYLGPTTGSFDQPHFHGHYAPNHVLQYQKYYDSDTGQFFRPVAPHID